LRILTPQWIRHNERHAGELRRWAERVQTSDAPGIAEDLLAAAWAIGQATDVLRRMQAALTPYEPLAPSGDSREHPRPARPVIEVRDFHPTYPDGHEALRGISLSVGEGEKVALVGPNGAGKSTLLLALMGLLKGKGILRLFGEELREDNARRLRGRIGLVFQDPDDQLFSPTVFDDVAYGPLYAGLPEPEIRQRVARALRQVGLEGFEGRLSHHLSMGEKKQAAIATVLAMQPEVLLLVEPSAGLDPQARRRLIEVLQNLPQTMIVATHDLERVETLLPCTIVLDGGKVVADGPTEGLLADVERLEAHGLR